MSYSGIPYLIPSGAYNRYKLQLALMKPFEDKKMCIGFGGVQRHFTEGHLKRDLCDKECNYVMECTVDYGFYADSVMEYAIANQVTDSIIRSKFEHSCNVLPSSIPIRGVYAILNDGILIGNANLINLNGYPKLVTAAHNIYKRGDGENLIPGDWSERPVVQISSHVMDKEKIRWGTNIFEEDGFFSRCS